MAIITTWVPGVQVPKLYTKLVSHEWEKKGLKRGDRVRERKRKWAE